MTDYVQKQQFMSEHALNRPGRVVERRICEEVQRNAYNARKNQTVEIEFKDLDS